MVTGQVFEGDIIRDKIMMKGFETSLAKCFCS